MINREIKFRVWDNFNKQMVYDYHRFDKTAPYILESSDYDDVFKTPYSFYHDWQDVDDGVSRPCFVMQYTGVKDKNGKEVYEGDIVKFRSHPDKSRVGAVKYSEENARFWILYFANDLERNRNYPSSKNFGQLNHLEVIGNIYENPELNHLNQQ